MKSKEEILESKGFKITCHKEDMDAISKMIVTPLLEAMDEYASQFFPPVFIEWILEYADMTHHETETDIYRRWVIEVETHIIQDFSTAELFEYWKTNVSKTK